VHDNNNNNNHQQQQQQHPVRAALAQGAGVVVAAGETRRTYRIVP